MIDLKMIEKAAEVLEGVARRTPLEYSKRLSKKYKANIYLKREDLQEVRSYKIRGAYNLMQSLTAEEKQKGVVCASAGNHAQGVAYSCNALQVKGTIFMPVVTPNQKIKKVKSFADGWVDIKLVGNTYDEASKASSEFCKKTGAVYVHPFDDFRTIAGQGTVGKEIYDELNGKVDYVVCSIGGGGLISGVSTFMKAKNQSIKVIGVESTGAPKMTEALKAGKVITLDKIDTFADGTAVKTAGENTFKIVRELVEKIVLIPEGQICLDMISLYQSDGIIAEPSGALAISALEEIAFAIEGKTVVCVLSGGNNDITRYPDVMERSLVYQGLKHYLLVEFTQKPGQLRQFLNEALIHPTDDIVRFEYLKKSNKEKAPAFVGLEVGEREHFDEILKEMDRIGINYIVITSDNLLYGHLV